MGFFNCQSRDITNAEKAIYDGYASLIAARPTNETVNPRNINANNITYGTVNVARLGSGSTGTNFLRSDNTWQTISAGSPVLTTKGDLYTYSTADIRLPVGTNGQVLTADSAATTGLTWSSNTGSRLLAVQRFSSGTSYTSNAPATKAYIEIVGGGGAGGGTSSTAGGAGGGGGSGGYSARMFTVTPSTAYTYSLGAAGTGNSAATGGNGGTTTITIAGVAMTALGGTGGAYLAGSTAIKFTNGGAGGAVGANCDLCNLGEQGSQGMTSTVVTVQTSGRGGNTPFGRGGASRPTNSAGAGNAGTGYGSGGSGSTSTTTTAYAGGAGKAGYIVVWEYT